MTPNKQRQLRKWEVMARNRHIKMWPYNSSKKSSSIHYWVEIKEYIQRSSFKIKYLYLSQTNFVDDWLIVDCLKFTGKYYMHVQDENKLTIDTTGRFCDNRGPPGWWLVEFWLPLGNEGIMDMDRNLALQQATYGPLEELLQGFFMCKELGTLFTRGIGLNLTILTGRSCKLDTSHTAKRTPHFSKRFTVGRKKTKWQYFYSQHTLWSYDICDRINKGNSSIPLFKTHKSMDKKQNRGNKLKLRETH